MGPEQDLNRRTGTSGGYHSDADSGDLKRDIDRTRSRMDETIDALSAKLQPRNLVHEALGWAGYESERAPSRDESVNSFLKSVGYDLLHSFRDSAKDATVAGAKKAGMSAWQVAKCHPMPSAVIGAGLAWLMYEGSCSLSGKAKAKGWKVYNPEPEYGGSYVDARTGRAYHEESYGRGTGATGGPASAHMPRSVPPTPDPTYGGSYVDARTGQPYNTGTYGQEAASMQNEPNRESNTGASCPPGYTPTTQAGAGSTSDQSSTGRGITGAARDTVSGAADTVRGGVSHMTDAARGGASYVGGTARSGAHYVTDTARTAASTLTHGVGAAGQTVRHGASTAAHTVTHTASSAAHMLSDGSRQALDQVRTGLQYGRVQARHTLEDYPLAVGAAALGVGLLLGLALPRTRREEELMGESARQLRERARQASQEAIERGKRAARETVGAVTEEIDRQGLTPGGLKDSVRGFASRVAEDLREEASEAGLTVGSVKEKARHIAERAGETAKQEIRGGEDNADSEGSTGPEGMAKPGGESQGAQCNV